MSRLEETRAVELVMQDYFDGLFFSDVSRLERAFHPQAHYFTASGGELLHYDMAEYFPIVNARASPASTGALRTDAIVAIDFVGPVTALVKAMCSIPPKHFLDVLTLVKVDDRWQIVAKVFHYEIRD
ncbi:nuclear transport factor 2 family protein [Cognatilysobacter bugurensis]|uniref:Nuclear transport factor 2 family protein n=1 Tax=Cognatilysobacter bugurensis TaxID=543356 RepID=A0A918SXA4_9GAMM|nr:nuclear transport factor 2 family protein [Lysobacter bugurensis]GHA76881.1 hypothetical protein GCM10007067_12710 [Lysobacter bugurensis]